MPKLKYLAENDMYFETYADNWEGAYVVRDAAMDAIARIEGEAAAEDED